MNLTGPQRLDASVKWGRKLASTKSETEKDYGEGSVECMSKT